MKYKTQTEYWLNKENNTLRGEFEQMYQDIDDPWGCYKGTSSLNNKIFIEVLFEEGTVYRDILDIGCGLGGLTRLIHAKNGGGRVTGIDISETAISKARRLHPHIQFECKNIMNDKLHGKYDLIILSEILWYILEKIEEIVMKLAEALDKDGIIGVHQYFPFSQNFGKEIINGVEGFDYFLETKTPFKWKRKVISYHDDGVVLLGTLKHV